MGERKHNPGDLKFVTFDYNDKAVIGIVLQAFDNGDVIVKRDKISLPEEKIYLEKDEYLPI